MIWVVWIIPQEKEGRNVEAAELILLILAVLLLSSGVALAVGPDATMALERWVMGGGGSFEFRRFASNPGHHRAARSQLLDSRPAGTVSEKWRPRPVEDLPAPRVEKVVCRSAGLSGLIRAWLINPNPITCSRTSSLSGAGLAGAEAAWQAAPRRTHVTLYEMRPAGIARARNRLDGRAGLLKQPRLEPARIARWGC